MGFTDTIIVSYDYNPEKDNAVLIVGRKKEGQVVDIINAFQDSEATELYNKLITVKNTED